MITTTIKNETAHFRALNKPKAVLFEEPWMQISTATFIDGTDVYSKFVTKQKACIGISSSFHSHFILRLASDLKHSAINFLFYVRTFPAAGAAGTLLVPSLTVFLNVVSEKATVASSST